MKAIRLFSLVCLMVSGLAVSAAYADTYALNDWCININGVNVTTLACNQGPPVSLPANVDGSNFDFRLVPDTTDNTLGTIKVTLGAGSGQYVLAYLDYDLHVEAIGSFADYGSTSGALPAGMVYEMDSPNSGVLFTDFSGNSLTNTNSVGGPCGSFPPCNDVAVSYGFQNLGPGVVTFKVSNQVPTGGFYLMQTSQEFGDSIYYTASFEPSGPPTIPEPGTLALLGSGFVALVGLRRWRQSR